MKNIFTIPDAAKIPLKEESFEDVLCATNVRVKRIISYDYASPKDFWYEQKEDEWFVILQGDAQLITKDENEKETLWNLKVGDTMFLKAKQKHRIKSTSRTPKTIWLALYGNITYGRV